MRSHAYKTMRSEAAEFMRTHDRFGKESIADMVASAERMEC